MDQCGLAADADAAGEIQGGGSIARWVESACGRAIYMEGRWPGARFDAVPPSADSCRHSVYSGADSAMGPEDAPAACQPTWRKELSYIKESDSLRAPDDAIRVGTAPSATMESQSIMAAASMTTRLSPGGHASSQASRSKMLAG
jgi:hypothetical protein